MYKLFQNCKAFSDFLTDLYQLPPVLTGDEELIDNKEALAKLFEGLAKAFALCLF
ncbi:hypothetical protein [Flavobacterium poyangense]|uniref:hypothetical protein n=1 Tax=Flavobacterium poyangense TaxID=2204302 RepID=UPI001422ECAE|nr:hypothetical protein [Flavobacterium sp. JXAS1]